MFSDEDSDPFSREGAERSVVCNNIVIPPSPTIIIRETPPETAVQRKNEVLFSDEEDIFDHVKNRPRAMKRRSNTAYDSFDDSFEQQNEPRPPKRKPSPDVVSDSFDDSFEQKTEPKPPGRKISLNDSFDDEVELVTNPAEQVKDGPAVGQPSTEEAPLCDSFDASFDRPVEFMPAPVQDDSFDDSCGNLVAAAVEEDIFDRGVVQNAEGDALHLITLRSDTEIRVSFDGSDAIRTPRAARANSFDGSDENRIAETMRKDSFDADDESLARSVPVQRHSIQRVAEEYSSIEKAMEVLDELTQQLKLAVSLQRDAETSRNSGLNLFPCALEGRHLSSGSHLLLLKIENKSQHDLRGWQLSISSGSADKTTHVGKSRSLDLGHVPVGGKKHLEVLTSSQAYEPSLYEMELYRIFDIDGHGSAFRIPLGWTLFSSLNQLSPRQDDEMLDNRRFNSTFCVPIGLVRLLCDGNLDEYAFLTHLLKPSNIEVLSQPITLSVSQESRNFVLKISVKDPLIRQTLKRDLQLYITLSVSQLRDFPQLNQIVLDFSTIDQLYESVVSSF